MALGISKYKLRMANTDTQPRYIPETRYEKPKSTRGGEFNIKKTGEDYIGKYIDSFNKQHPPHTSPNP